MFHSPRCITVASLVSFVPATSLEAQKANAADASMLCQQNVKTMYFKTLNPRLFNLDSDLRFSFSLRGNMHANAANFQRVCLARARGNFGWSYCKNIKFKAFVYELRTTNNLT